MRNGGAVAFTSDHKAKYRISKQQNSHINSKEGPESTEKAAVRA